MEAPEFKRLPFGYSSFATLRLRDMIYVDKTDRVVSLIDSASFVFLARPRRFGKSLLVSVIGDLFEHGAEAFQGLKAERLWTERTYPVLRLDFSLCKASAHDEFRRKFDEVIEEAIFAADLAERASPETDADFGCDPIRRWRKFLRAQKPSSLVVLIDEYDAPLTAHLNEVD